MSKPNDNPTLIPVDSDESVTEKKSFIRRNVVDPIKNHKKTAAAAGLFVGLIVVSTIVGRNSSSNDNSTEDTNEPAEATADTVA